MTVTKKILKNFTEAMNEYQKFCNEPETFDNLISNLIYSNQKISMGLIQFYNEAPFKIKVSYYVSSKYNLDLESIAKQFLPLALAIETFPNHKSKEDWQTELRNQLYLKMALETKEENLEALANDTKYEEIADCYYDFEDQKQKCELYNALYTFFRDQLLEKRTKHTDLYRKAQQKKSKKKKYKKVVQEDFSKITLDSLDEKAKRFILETGLENIMAEYMEKDIIPYSDERIDANHDYEAALFKFAAKVQLLHYKEEDFTSIEEVKKHAEAIKKARDTLKDREKQLKIEQELIISLIAVIGSEDILEAEELREAVKMAKELMLDLQEEKKREMKK